MTPDCALLFLIGYRGTGKSSVGRLLAELLGWNFVDADAVLEQTHGQSIRTIFAEKGEEGFRDMEEAVLVSLCELRHHVIATGGGVILRDANRSRLRTHGKVVWLTADADTIWQRLEGDAHSAERRPILTVGGKAEIEVLLEQRRPLYDACADVIVSTAGRSPIEVSEIAWKQLTHGIG